MKYLEDINDYESIKVIILFLIEKANYYKEKNKDLYSSYVNLINKYVLRLEKIGDHFE